MINLINSYNTYINDYRNKEKAFLDNFKPNIFQKEFSITKGKKKIGVIPRGAGKSHFIIQRAVKLLVEDNKGSFIVCHNFIERDSFEILINTILDNMNKICYFDTNDHKIFYKNNYIKILTKHDLNNLQGINICKYLFIDNIDCIFNYTNIIRLIKKFDNVIATTTTVNKKIEDDILHLFSEIYIGKYGHEDLLDYMEEYDEYVYNFSERINE